MCKTFNIVIICVYTYVYIYIYMYINSIDKIISIVFLVPNGKIVFFLPGMHIDIF